MTTIKWWVWHWLILVLSIATVLDFLVDKRSWEIIEKIPLYDVGLLIWRSLIITKKKNNSWFLVYIKNCNKLILGNVLLTFSTQRIDNITKRDHLCQSPTNSCNKMSTSFADTQHQLCEQMLQNCPSPENWIILSPCIGFRLYGLK
jgi:hypothetical protein